MSQLPDNLSQMFNDYFEMQQLHLNEIQTVPDFDIKKQNFERAKAFANLKNELNQMFRHFKTNQNDEKNLEIARECQEKITEILSTDKTISEKIENYKTEIKKRLVKMNTGKKVLNAYKHNLEYR